MGNKRQVRHQRRTEDRLIIEVTNKGKAPLDSSKWKCNWINCIGGRGLSSSGFCSEGGDWGKKNCITFKAIPSPSPQPLEEKIRQKVCQLTCGDDLCEGAKDKFYCPDCNATTQDIMQAIAEQGKDEPFTLEENLGFELCGEIKCNDECGGYLFCRKIETLVQKILRFVSASQPKCAECKAEAIKQFTEKCIEAMPKVMTADDKDFQHTNQRIQRDEDIAHIRAMAKKGESHE